MRKSSSGFTIVELLIVIVVIAILATIALVSYNGIQTRARTAAIVSELTATEKALRAYAAVNGTDWIRDNDARLTGISNPYIHEIIDAQPEFKSFLAKRRLSKGWIPTNGFTITMATLLSAAAHGIIPASI